MSEPSGHVRKIERRDRPPNWRAATAVAREADALTVDAWLELTAEIEALLEHKRVDGAASELRSVAASLRTLRNDWLDEAEQLRAALHGQALAS